MSEVPDMYTLIYANMFWRLYVCARGHARARAYTCGWVGVLYLFHYIYINICIQLNKYTPKNDITQDELLLIHHRSKTDRRRGEVCFPEIIHICTYVDMYVCMYMERVCMCVRERERELQNFLFSLLQV